MQIILVSSKEQIHQIRVFGKDGQELSMQVGVDLEVPDDATEEQFGDRYARPAFACIKNMKEYPRHA